MSFCGIQVFGSTSFRNAADLATGCVKAIDVDSTGLAYALACDGRILKEQANGTYAVHAADSKAARAIAVGAGDTLWIVDTGHRKVWYYD